MCTNSFFNASKIELQHVTSTEKPQLNHSNAAKRGKSKAKELFVNKKSLDLQR